MSTMPGDESKEKNSEKPISEAGERPETDKSVFAIDTSKLKAYVPDNKKAKVGVAILVALALLVGAGLLSGMLPFGRQPHSATQPDGNGQPVIADARKEKHELVLEQLPFEKLQPKISNFELTGQYEEAEKLIRHQDYFKTNFDAQLLLATVFMNAGKHAEALEVLQGIEKAFGESRAVAESIGDMAAKTGDKVLAKTYYEKAIAILRASTTNPLAKYDIEDIEKKIAELER